MANNIPQFQSPTGLTRTLTQSVPKTTAYTGTSIVDYLKSAGRPSDYQSRSVLAKQQGIIDYQGTAQQNIQLLGILKGTSITPKTITPANISPTTTTDITKAPVVDSRRADLEAQIASVQGQVELKQKEFEAAKVSEAETAEKKSIWTSLMGQQKTTQEAITKSQQNLLAQQEAIYEKWGLTPENYQEIQDLTTQITAYQKQIADLDTREAQAIDAIQNRPGVDLAFASGESARIQRAYAIQRAGIAANASVLASQAQAMQGNWDNAFKSAQLYVDNATKAQQQVVSDLKWGFENFSDIIQAMTTDEQKRINDQLDYEADVLKLQQEDYWKQIDANFKQQGLEVDWYEAQTARFKATKEQAVGGVQTLTGKPLTDTQALSLGYGRRMADANVVIAELESEFTGGFGVITGSRFFPNIFKTDARQRIEQAQRNFINATLRRESGAAIAPSEFDSAAKQYFPQPGDSNDTLIQKANNRKRVISNMALSANVSLSEITEEIEEKEIISPGGGTYEDYLKALK